MERIRVSVIAKNFVILQHNSEGIALYMLCKLLMKIHLTPVVLNWSYRENWKSTAPVCVHA